MTALDGDSPAVPVTADERLRVTGVALRSVLASLSVLGPFIRGDDPLVDGLPLHVPVSLLSLDLSQSLSFLLGLIFGLVCLLESFDPLPTSWLLGIHNSCNIRGEVSEVVRLELVPPILDELPPIGAGDTERKEGIERREREGDRTERGE